MRRYTGKIVTCLCMLILALPQAVRAQDTERPVRPVLNRVSVNPGTGKAWLEWEKSPSTDVAAYIIYIDKNSSWIAIDTLRDPQATSYTNTKSNASFYAESYVVAAYDSAGNPSPLTSPHTTMFASVSFDSCRVRNSLSWTPYLGWGANLERYEVILNRDGGPDSLLAILAAGQTGYLHEEIQAYSEFCYHIRARNLNGKVSNSNRVCTYAGIAKPPGYINADFATVEGTDEIRLSFTIDPVTEIGRFRLFRGTGPGSPAEVIAAIDNPGSWTVEYTDGNRDLTKRYYYRLGAINACDTVIKWSNSASNLVLEVVNREVVNYLNWSPYYSWLGGVDAYVIYRQVENSSPEIIATLPGTDTAYADDISDLQYIVPDGKFCYHIEATEGPLNPAGVKGVALSNTACGEIEIKVFIPNAFTPNSDNLNDQFRPLLSFTPEKYHLVIRNRWGNILFETKDPWEEWDGTVRGGRTVPEGAYIYTLRIVTSEGEVIERNGHLSVIYRK